MSTRFIIEIRENEGWKEIDANVLSSNLSKEQLKTLVLTISDQFQRQARIRKVIDKILFVTPKPTISLVNAA
jgi:hypothetical protein